MSEIKVRTSLQNLKRAIARLREAIEEDVTHCLVIDGTIQRFEFTLELFWKALKRCLAFEGITAMTPREVLKKAYQIGWIADELIWLQMLKDRNETSHVYQEEMADKIYQHIRTYVPVLEQTYAFLEEKYSKGE